MHIVGSRKKSFTPESTFLPFQQKAILDPSRVILWEKSRRIGATWSIAYRAVRRGAMMATPMAPKSWFSSADDTAAAEYIDYCAFWARQVQVKAEVVEQCLYDSEQDITSRALVLANKYEIHALTSNHRQFRSKGGDGYWDEAAHHDNPLAMWKAINALKVWGGSLFVLSTHNGPGSLFNRLIEDVKHGRRKGWSLHTTTINDAMKQGMLDKILGKKAGKKEINDFLEELKTDALDDETWQQEFLCIPIDEAAAFMPYDLLYTCERDGIIVDDLKQCTGNLYLGMDIGRHKHLTVFYVLEEVPPMLITRKVIVLEKQPFPVQREALYSLLNLRGMQRARLDATGMGEQLAEEATIAYGTYKVEGLKLTAPMEQTLAHGFKREFEDKTILTPPEFDLREDLHSMRKVVTAKGNISFKTLAPERLGHADRFWAGALAVHAARAADGSPPFMASRKTGGQRVNEKRMRQAFHETSSREGGYRAF